jgi:polyferredoxin
MNKYVILALLILLSLLWFAIFGLWPFAHPPHDFSTPLSVLDIALHWAALFTLFILVIENHPRTARRLPE